MENWDKKINIQRKFYKIESFTLHNVRLSIKQLM